MALPAPGGEVPDEGVPEGEFPAIRERLVVAPHWGRVHEEPLEEGRILERGAVIGGLRDGGTETPLRCPQPAVFLAWLVTEGERVAPGSPVALLRVTDGEA